MSHYDKFKAIRAYLCKHPSIIVLVAGSIICFISSLVAMPYNLIAYMFIVAGILLSINENRQDDKELKYWQTLAKALNDQQLQASLKWASETLRHHAEASSILTTLHGGRVYRGVVRLQEGQYRATLTPEGEQEA